MKKHVLAAVAAAALIGFTAPAGAVEESEGGREGAQTTITEGQIRNDVGSVGSQGIVLPLVLLALIAAAAAAN